MELQLSGVNYCVQFSRLTRPIHSSEIYHHEISQNVSINKHTLNGRHPPQDGASCQAIFSGVVPHVGM